MLKSIDNIGISVSKLEDALAFYEKIGFKKTQSFDRHHIVEQGPIKLHLFETEVSNPKKQDRTIWELVKNPVGINHISFYVDDVDKVYEECKKNGVHFDDPPSDKEWGARAVGCKDPDGNPVIFLKWL